MRSSLITKEQPMNNLRLSKALRLLARRLVNLSGGRIGRSPDENSPTMIWGHWQNLNEKGNSFGNPIRNGRAWLRSGDLNFNIEWNLGTLQTAVKLKLGDDEYSVKWHAALPGIAIYAGVDHPWLRSLFRSWTEARDIRVAIHDGSIWWDIWTKPHYWSSSTPRWRSNNFSIQDLVLGPLSVSEVILQTEDVIIPMPEGLYEGKVTLSRQTRSRSRWFDRHMQIAYINMKTGIPVPGKGENSWDCGQDSLHGMSTTAASISEAIGKVVADVLRTRMRRANINWKPEPSTQETLPS